MSSDTVNIHEAKTHLSKLLARVEAGEEITLARAGKPIARLAPVPAQANRQPGAWKGLLSYDDPDEPLKPLDDADAGLVPSPTDPLNS